MTLLGAAVLGAQLGVSAAQAAEVRLVMDGGSDDLRDTLRQVSSSFEVAENAASTPLEIVAAAQSEYRRLTAALYDAGYFGPVISVRLDGREAASLSPVQAPNSVRSVVIAVETGPQFLFGTTALSPVARDTDIPAGFSQGQVARTSVIRDAAARGIDGWRADGYAKATTVREDITARYDTRRLDVAIGLDPGPRLRFGDLVIGGNEDVRTKRIADIAGLPNGQIFSPDEIRRVATRLQRTGTFRSVSLTEAETPSPDGTLDILLQVEENLPRRFGFGAEISSLEGLGVSAFWLHRNLFGGAERLRFDAEIEGIGGDSGGEDFRLAARFDRPATFNEDTDFFATAEIERRDEVNFLSRQASVAVGILRYARDERTYSFGLGLRRSRTQDVFGTRDFTLFTVPLGLEFDYRDDRLNATTGYYLKADIMPFFGISGSDDGARTLVDARAYYTPGDDGPVTLALRGQLGALNGPNNSQAPADFLFFSGGGGTVRGQPFQALGVDLGLPELAGGRAFLGLSAEARVKTTDSLSLVGFFDAGYIGSESFPNGSSGQWHTGAGLGLRYDTGIGPIRLDVGVPVSGPGDNTGFEVYIGIGQAF